MLVCQLKLKILWCVIFLSSSGASICSRWVHICSPYSHIVISGILSITLLKTYLSRNSTIASVKNMSRVDKQSHLTIHYTTALIGYMQIDHKKTVHLGSTVFPNFALANRHRQQRRRSKRRGTKCVYSQWRRRLYRQRQSASYARIIFRKIVWDERHTVKVWAFGLSAYRWISRSSEWLNKTEVLYSTATDPGTCKLIWLQEINFIALISRMLTYFRSLILNLLGFFCCVFE